MLIITMNVIVILSAMAGAFLLVAFSDNKEHLSARSRMKAFYIAEAALSVALADVRVGGEGQIGSRIAPVSFNSGTYFTETVREGDVVIVVAVGAYGGETQAIEGVIDQSSAGDAFFTSAAGGESSVQVLDAAYTDSYDSSAGSYSEAIKTEYLGFSVANPDGDIESNGNIDLDFTAAVYGDADVQSTGNLTGGDVVFGSTGSSVKRKYLEVVGPGLDSQFLGPVVMFSGSTTLTPGAWGASTVALLGTSTVTVQGPATLVVESLQVSQEARLLIDDANGPVFVYVTGGLQMTGPRSEVRSLSGSPKSLLVYAHLDNYTGFESSRTGDPTRPLMTAGNSSFHGVLYAPNGTINVAGASQIFGSAFGEKVVLEEEGSIHFDEALSEIPTLPLGGGDVATEWTTGPGGFGLPGGELVTWRKVAPTVLTTAAASGDGSGGASGGK